MHKEFTILEDIVVHSVPVELEQHWKKVNQVLFHNLWETIIL